MSATVTVNQPNEVVLDGRSQADLRELANHSTQENYSPALSELNAPLVSELQESAERPYASRR